jgi:hypothetical protein
MKFVFLLAFCVVCSVADLSCDVPLFAWSGAGAFVGKNIGLPSALTASDVESLLDSFVKGASVPTSFSDSVRSVKPEVLVVYLESQLRLAQVSFHASQLGTLKNLMLNSRSSIFVPHLDLSASLLNTVVEVGSSANTNGGSVIFAGKGSVLLPELKNSVPQVKAVSLAKLEEFLSTSKVFSNGVTDIIFVQLDDESNLQQKFTNTNHVIEAVNSAISAKTQNYVSVYTGLKYEAVDWGMSFSSKRYLSSVFDVIIDETNNGTNGTQPNWFQVYFPGWFWEVVVGGLFFIPFVISGFCVMLGLQAPEHFVPPSKAKHAKRT